MRNDSHIVYGKPAVFHDFEKAVLNAVIDRLCASDAEILRSQLQLLNHAYEEYDDASRKLTIYYFWRTFFGRNRTDFPKRWAGDTEKVLARIDAVYGEKYRYHCEIVTVLGRMFAIELSSNADDLRPISPHFVFSEIEVYPNGGVPRTN